MRRTWLLPLTLCLTLAAVPCLRADDQAEARAILDRAIKAAGGQARLAGFPAAHLKVKGTYRASGEEVPFTGEWFTDGYTRMRTVVVITLNGARVREVRVVNGDRGWVKIDDKVSRQMDAKRLAEARESLYQNQVTLLAPLRDRAFTLTPLGESTIHGRPALGLKVSQKGHKDIRLFFDKQNWLLLKTEWPTRDPETGKEVNSETFCRGYKEIQGTQQATRLKVQHDGKTVFKLTYTEVKLLDKLDDQLFTRP
jgi:hypothetical protein